MSSLTMRRADRAMTQDQARQMLVAAYSGRLATVSVDGSPYCVPLLYICMDRKLYLHTTSAGGHLRVNVERDARVCFEIDEPNGVFDYASLHLVEHDLGLPFERQSFDLPGFRVEWSRPET